MANDIDAAQERGDLGRRGGDRSKVQTSDFATAGVDKRRVSEWREVRDAGEDAPQSPTDGRGFALASDG